MLTNAKVTIFNQWPDRESRKMVFIPHVIHKVWFHTNQKSTVGENGLRSADEYQIRIPYSECADWISPDEFNRLTEVYGKWTVRNGDFFILGEWDGGNVTGIEDIRKRFSGTIGKVLSHSENFFGSSKHIRIGGGS